MAAPSQDQLVAQLRLIIPAIGTIVSAVGVSSVSVDHWTGILLASVGPSAYVATAIWSLYANSRASIMASAAKPVAPGVPAPQIILPHEEKELAEALPANVTSPPDKK